MTSEDFTNIVLFPVREFANQITKGIFYIACKLYECTFGISLHLTYVLILCNIFTYLHVLIKVIIGLNILTEIYKFNFFNMLLGYFILKE